MNRPRAFSTPDEQGGDRHARQVGHGDLGQDHRQLELRRVVREARVDDVHQPRHGQLADDGEGHGGRRQGGQGVGRPAGRRPSSPSVASVRGVGRHEGGGEGALGEDAAEQVREGQRRVVGVGRDGLAGAQPGGDHQVAGQAHEPADQGQGREDQRRAQDALPLRGILGRGLAGARLACWTFWGAHRCVVTRAAARRQAGPNTVRGAATRRKRRGPVSQRLLYLMGAEWPRRQTGGHPC